MNAPLGLLGWAKIDELRNGSDQIVQTQAKFAEAGYYTVQFSVDFGRISQITSEAPPIFVLADIIWNVASNSITRTISVFNGATISGLAHSVTVNMRDFSAPPDPDEITYRVSCSIAKGQRPSTSAPPTYSVNTESTRTEAERRGQLPLVTVNPGANVSFSPPPNIGVNAVYLLCMPAIAGSTITIDEMNDLVRTTKGPINQWVPLPVGLPFLSIGVELDATAAGPVDVQPIWGVEG